MRFEAECAFAFFKLNILYLEHWFNAVEHARKTFTTEEYGNKRSLYNFLYFSDELLSPF